MIMRRITFAFLSLCLLCACSKESSVELVSVTDTGCAREEVATRGGTLGESLLILEYSHAGLVVTRTNVELNCSIKTGGVSCNVSCEGGDIYCEVFETEGKSLRCTCPVKSVTATVAGLQLGHEYTIYFTCGDSFIPISFTYSEDLNMVLDAGLYMR